ncbi:MAG: tetratricopeptide repeat protein [Thermodesulfobacteriota bacterium]
MKRTPLAEISGGTAAFVCLALVLAVLAVYGPSLHHGFAPLDDDEYVTANPRVLSGFTLKGVIWALSFNDQGYWHPLTWLSHMLDCQLYGTHPMGHHLTNLLLHAANVLLLFLVLKSLTGALWRSAAVAALFALHPLNVESVVWVANRKNLLSTLFWMLTICAYARYAKQPGYATYFWALVCLGLGLMAKPMLVTIPVVLLLFDYWPLGRLRPFSVKRDLVAESSADQPRPALPSPSWVFIEKLPFAVLSVASVLVSLLSAQSRNILVSGESVPIHLRIENALVSYVTYLHKTIWPTDLALFYPYPDVIPDWQWAGSGLLLLVGTGIVLLTARKAPFLPVGWLWYLITLLPVTGLIQQGLWPAWSDRFAYVPLIGLFILPAWGIPALLSGRVLSRNGLALISSAAIVVLGGSACVQVRIWGDNEGVLRHAVAVAPRAHLARFNLACLLLSKGRAEEAITEFREAVRIFPLNPAFHNGLGNALLSQGRYAEATAHLREAVRIWPDYPEALTNLGSALRQQKDWEEAANQLRKALRIKPVPEAYHNLGLLFAAQGQFRHAISQYEHALRIKPSDGRVHNDLAAALYALGHKEKAMSHLTEALRLNPQDVMARRNYHFIRRRLETEAPGGAADRKNIP